MLYSIFYNALWDSCACLLYKQYLSWLLETFRVQTVHFPIVSANQLNLAAIVQALFWYISSARVLSKDFRIKLWCLFYLPLVSFSVIQIRCFLLWQGIHNTLQFESLLSDLSPLTWWKFDTYGSSFLLQVAHLFFCLWMTSLLTSCVKCFLFRILRGSEISRKSATPHNSSAMILWSPRLKLEDSVENQAR